MNRGGFVIVSVKFAPGLYDILPTTREFKLQALRFGYTNSIRGNLIFDTELVRVDFTTKIFPFIRPMLIE